MEKAINNIHVSLKLTSFDDSGNRKDITVSSKGTGGIATLPKGMHSFISISLFPCSFLRVKLWGWQTFPIIEELLNN